MTRLKLLLDDGEYEPLRCRLCAPAIRSGFVDSKPYSERLQAMQQATNLSDAHDRRAGSLAGRRVQICAMEPRFIGGSMGSRGRREDHARDRALPSRSRSR